MELVNRIKSLKDSLAAVEKDTEEIETQSIEAKRLWTILNDRKVKIQGFMCCSYAILTVFWTFL